MQDGLDTPFTGLRCVEQPAGAHRAIDRMASVANRMLRIDRKFDGSPTSPLSFADTSLSDLVLPSPAFAVAPQSIWPNLTFCMQFAPCRILTAMMAFAWLGWTTLVGLIAVAILNVVHKARPARAPIMVEWAAGSSFGRQGTVHTV